LYPGSIDEGDDLNAPGWLDHMGERQDGDTLGAFRVLFGVLLAVQAIALLATAEAHYVTPVLLFPYEGFGWLPRPSAPALYGLGGAMVLAGVGVAAGVWFRACLVTFALSFGYVFLIEQTHYNNHYYLLLLLCALLLPSGADRCLSRQAESAALVPRWPLLLLRAQLVLVYAFAALAKLNADWLQGEPLHHWLALRGGDGRWAGLASSPWVALFLAYGGLAFDALVGPALLWSRTRKWACAFAGVFHLSNALLFEIGIFPWLMLASLLLFLEPGSLRRALARRGRPIPAPPPLPGEDASVSQAVSRVVVVLSCAYLLVQVAVPLRHWLYPGNVAWTEEGHRFAWRMKLRSKQIEFVVLARDPAQPRTWTVNLPTYLTPKQRHEVSTRPHLLHRLAGEVRLRLEEELGRPVEIHVRARGSLNYRAHVQDLVDVERDLSRADYPLFGSADWIVPLDETAYFASDHRSVGSP
jgi:hypothetical protein